MKKYFNVYDEKIREELFKMPICALGLPTEVEKALIESGAQLIGKGKNTFTTVGDLLKNGKDKTQYMISREVYYTQNRTMMRDIEESLIKLGFTFADSNFSVYDVRSSQLKIREKTKAFVNKYLKSSETIGDLSLYSVKRLMSFVDDKDYSVVLDLKIALENYGIKFVDAKYDLDKTFAFPIKDYVQYLSPKTRLEYKQNPPVPRKLVRTKERVIVELNKKIKDDSDEPNS